MSDYICERGCCFTSALEVPVVQVYGPDERAYCAFCEYKRPVSASFNKGFEHIPTITEYCIAVREDFYPLVKKMVAEASNGHAKERGEL